MSPFVATMDLCLIILVVDVGWWSIPWAIGGSLAGVLGGDGTTR